MAEAVEERMGEHVLEGLGGHWAGRKAGLDDRRKGGRRVVGGKGDGGGWEGGG